jgi:hypothetical protein
LSPVRLDGGQPLPTVSVQNNALTNKNAETDYTVSSLGHEGLTSHRLVGDVSSEYARFHFIHFKMDYVCSHHRMARFAVSLRLRL